MIRNISRGRKHTTSVNLTSEQKWKLQWTESCESWMWYEQENPYIVGTFRTEASNTCRIVNSPIKRHDWSGFLQKKKCKLPLQSTLPSVDLLNHMVFGYKPHQTQKEHQHTSQQGHIWYTPKLWTNRQMQSWSKCASRSFPNINQVASSGSQFQ